MSDESFNPEDFIPEVSTSNTNLGNKSNFFEGSKEFLESNNLVSKFAFLILVIFIFFILLRIGLMLLTYIFSFSQNPIIIDGMIDGDSRKSFSTNPNDKKAVPIYRSKDKMEGLEFTWSVWLWIKNPPKYPSSGSKTNQYHHVFNKGSISTSGGNNGILYPNNGPGLYISENYRKLVVIMNSFDHIENKVEIEDIPINKWVNVIIRCTQNILDIFINGTLVKSLNLKDVPKQNYDNINVAYNGGFNGKISSLRYFSTSIGTNKIQSIVENGPNTKGTGTDLTSSKPYYLSLRWFFSFD